MAATITTWSTTSGEPAKPHPVELEIETSSSGTVASETASISSGAPQRSIGAAPLKNAHHTRTPSPPSSAPTMATGAASGASSGSPIQVDHNSVTMTIPGRSLSARGGCRGAVLITPVYDGIGLRMVPGRAISQ